MGAIAGPRPFQRNGHGKPSASFQKSAGVLLPIFAIKIHGQKETGFVTEHGVQTHYKTSPDFISA